MASVSLKEQIVRELDRLTQEQQERLLAVAKRLQKSVLPPGTPGEVLIDYMDQFEFAPGEVDVMMRVINENCEKPEVW